MNQPALPLQPVAGEARKIEGIEQVLANERREWRQRALARIVRLAEQHRTFTADEVREACSDIEPPHHPNVWGAVMHKAIRAGIIRRTGELRRSTRKAAHSHSNPVWESLLWNQSKNRPTN